MIHAIRIHATGDASQLVWEPVDVAAPGDTVLVMTDGEVGHMRERIELPSLGTGQVDDLEIWDRAPTEVPPEWYKAYDNETGDVPPLAPFGEGYRYHITGLLHDSRGFPTERLDEIQPWVERVFRKLDRNLDEIAMWQQDGVEDARVLVVAYGSTARSAQQALKIARARYGRKVGLLRLKTLWPFPEDLVERLAEEAQRVIVAEMNLGQIALEVERIVGRRKVVRVGRADGRIVTPDQIVDAIRAPRPQPARARRRLPRMR